MKQNAIELPQEVQDQNLAEALKEIMVEASEMPSQYVKSVDTPLGGE